MKLERLKVGFGGHQPIIVTCTLAFLAVFAGDGQAGTPSHGFSPIHELKYSPGFSHFEYAQPSAPKGGVVRLAETGTFDSLNPLHYPGRVPSVVTRYVFDTLLVRSGDEPAAYYGLLARTVEVADDLGWVRFTLNEKARWHDGRPVSAEDVAYTFRTLREQGAPFYRQALRLYEVEVLSPTAVMFRARRRGDRDMVRILGVLMPIHAKHFWNGGKAEKGGLDHPLGSGPYRVARVIAGRTVELERVGNYWAANHPVNRGRYNFDRIKVDYYRDDSVALEAFRAGEFDLRLESDAAQWAQAYDGIARAEGKIRKEVLRSETPGELTTLVFNVRQPAFQDLRVRQAITLAYDFEWTNKTLFHGLYKPLESFYGDTHLAAHGPMSAAERELLKPVMSQVPAGALERATPPLREGIRDRRAALERADSLLRAAGYVVRDGVRVHRQSGEALTIQLVHANPHILRVLGPFAGNLKRLGIELRYPVLDAVTATRRKLDRDFDMAVLNWSPRWVAGNAERLLWGSASADRPGSYALAGVKDPALDVCIDAMSKARDWSDLETATRAFDRVMRWRHYVIPLWRKDRTWLAYWDKFGRPELSPRFSPSVVDLWWSRPEGALTLTR